MSRVAISADRRLHVADSNRVTMGATLVIVVDLCVATSARPRDIGLESRACGIRVAQNVVRSMAALTICRYQQSFLAQCKSMNGVHV